MKTLNDAVNTSCDIEGILDLLSWLMCSDIQAHIGENTAHGLFTILSDTRDKATTLKLYLTSLDSKPPQNNLQDNKGGAA